MISIRIYISPNNYILFYIFIIKIKNIMKKSIVMTLLVMAVSMVYAANKREIINFDCDWLFARFGLMALPQRENATENVL